jgi:hypothetical protein
VGAVRTRDPHSTWASPNATFAAITSGAEVLRYSIEFDAYRAEQARQRIPNIIQGNTLEVQCAVETVASTKCPTRV